MEDTYIEPGRLRETTSVKKEKNSSGHYTRQDNVERREGMERRNERQRAVAGECYKECRGVMARRVLEKVKQ